MHTEVRAAQDAAGAPLFIVLNAGSGRQDAEDTARTIERVLGEAGRPYEILSVEDSQQIAAAARRAVTAARRADGVVVAAGGDGTLNAVAQEALGTGCLFGVIPQGTFNYFGRTQGISSQTETATRALLSAEVVPVQVGLLNDRVFLVNASLGVYPQLLEDREAREQRLGRSRWVAAWSALLTLVEGYRPMRICLERDGRTQELRTLSLFVGNNRLQLEQIGLPEAEAVEAHRLVAILVKPVSTPALLGLMVRGALRDLGRARGVVHFPLTDMTVSPASARGRKLKVALDGEILWMPTPIRFRVAPQPLMTLLPVDAKPETVKT